MEFLKKAIYLLLTMATLFSFVSCQSNNQPKKQPLIRPDESFLKYGETNETIVELTKINNNVWVHTSYYEDNGSLISSNGLVVLTEKNIILINTPWTEQQMESLDKLVHKEFNGGFELAVITHADLYRMGGTKYLKKLNITVNSLEIVANTALLKGFIVPDQISNGDSYEFKVDNTDFEIFYPGEGSTKDNTVVWIEKYKLLFTSYLVKQYGEDSLGNIKQTNLNVWSDTIKALQEKYPEAEIVVPGHGQWGDTSLIDYTLELLDE